MHLKEPKAIRLFNRKHHGDGHICIHRDRALVQAELNDPECECPATFRKALHRQDFWTRENVAWDDSARFLRVKFRSWKRHSKCRHQWEKHAVPVIGRIGMVSYALDFAKDHYRKDVLARLHSKGNCVFDARHNDLLASALDGEYEGVRTVRLTLDGGADKHNYSFYNGNARYECTLSIP